MNISLPAPLKSWVEQQVAERGYSTASEFVRDILRTQQAAQGKARVEAVLIEAIESGPSQPMKREDWARIRRQGMKAAKARKRR